MAQLPGLGYVLRLVRAQTDALIALPDGLVALPGAHLLQRSQPPDTSDTDE